MLSLIVMLAVALLASIALPVVSIVLMVRLRDEVRQLSRRVALLERAGHQASASAAVSPPSQDAPVSATAPPAAPPTWASPEPVPPPIPAASASVFDGSSAPPPPPTATPGAAMPPSAAVPAAAAPPVEAMPAPAAAPAFSGAIGQDEAETLETRIGGRLLLYAGMLVLVLGLAFFLRYAFEREWMSPPVRVALGVIAGVGMAAGGYRLAATYRNYGLFLSGGGIAILYLSVYAALNLYGLIPPLATFVLLVAITVAGALLADRTRSQPMALMAVLGGFLVPFLVGGDRDAQVTLFTYVALLVAATMFLAWRHEWPWLNVASLAFTALTVVAWADVYYTPDKYLRTHAFLTIYCAMFLSMLLRAWRTPHPHRDIVSSLLALAPVAYHITSVMILRPHEVALPIYLVVVTVVGVIAALHYELPWLRLVVWVAVALPLAPWLEEHQSRGWLAGTVATLAGIHLVHLAAQIRNVTRGTHTAPDVVLLQANGIGFYAGLYAALFESFTPGSLALIAAALAGVNAAIWWAMRRVDEDAAIQWAGTAFTLVAMAVALQFDGPWAVAMWAAEAVVVAWVAIRQDREWLRLGSIVLFALAIVRWLSGDVQEVYLGQGAFVNARSLSGFFVVAALYVVSQFQRGERDASTVLRLHQRAAILVAASALTVFITSVEINAFWEVRTSAGSDAYLARELMLSASWAAYAALLVVIGIRRRYAPIRYFAIALFGLTLLKVFLVDLGTVGGIYRVVGFVVIGVILLLVSFLYQRK